MRNEAMLPHRKHSNLISTYQLLTAQWIEIEMAQWFKPPEK
jgi:hypothetical protein